jgi:hypothetical protein
VLAASTHGSSNAAWEPCWFCCVVPMPGLSGACRLPQGQGWRTKINHGRNRRDDSPRGRRVNKAPEASRRPDGKRLPRPLRPVVRA